MIRPDSLRSNMTVARLCFLLLFVFAFSAVGQTVERVDVNQLTDELQQDSPVSDELTMVWWIPPEYWRIVLEGEKLAKPDIEEFVAVLRPYTIVAVFDGKIDGAGNTTFRSEADVRKSIRLIDAAGTEYAPMAVDQIGPTPREMLKLIRPMIVNALGKVGTNFYFIVFPAADAKGGLIADPRKEGMMRIRLTAKREFKWKLPLVSLLQPKKCPIDGEKMRGDWRYCPWHGAELKP